MPAETLKCGVWRGVSSDRGPHMKALRCWGGWSCFWAPVTKGTGGCSGTPQWCSHPVKRSRCGHSVREVMEAAFPGRANGKPAVTGLWDLWTTGRQLGGVETQTLGESFLNLITSLLVSWSADHLCFPCLLEVSLSEVTQCEHRSATTVKEKLQGQIVQDHFHTLVWTRLCFLPCHLSDFYYSAGWGPRSALGCNRKKNKFP